MDNTALLKQLRQVRHFAGFTDDDLLTIVSSGHILMPQAGTTIFRESEPTAGMHVLIRGLVHLIKLGPNGQENIIGIIQPVIMFNEVAVLDGGPNPVTALAVQDSLLWRIAYPEFQALLQRYPMLGVSLLHVLAARNRHLMAHYEDLAFRTVLGRTAKLLLDLSTNGQHQIVRREHSVQQMAGRIATVPEALCRSLNTFKSDGLIASTRTVIQVLHPEKLAEIAQLNLTLKM